MTSRNDKAGTTSYTYDQADRLATVADPLTGATLSYGYNADSLPTSVSYAKGGTAGPAQTLAYNGLQQLTSDTLTSATDATIASASYGYNANGDLTSQATTGYAGAGSTTYGYSEADQLTSATTGGTTTSYGYDADGDLTQAGGHQLQLQRPGPAGQLHHVGRHHQLRLHPVRRPVVGHPAVRHRPGLHEQRLRPDRHRARRDQLRLRRPRAPGHPHHRLGHGRPRVLRDRGHPGQRRHHQLHLRPVR